MHAFFIYDESVCKTTDPCAEFKEQMNVLKKLSTNSQFNSFTHLDSVLNSGKYARYVIRKHQRLIFNELLDDAVNDYSLSPSNLARVLAMVLSEIYKRGDYSKDLDYKSAVMIFTGTEIQDMDIVQELLAEIFMHSGSVYTVGAGNNVQEDILKNMSSPPQEKNKNYFLQMHYETLSKVMNKEYNSLCGTGTSDDEDQGIEDNVTINYDYETSETDTTSANESTEDDFQFITGHIHSQEMNAMDDSETSKLTRLPLKGEEIFGMNGNRLFFGILLLLLLLLFLIFAGVYYLFSNKNKISKSDVNDTPDEEEEDENENPPVRNTDSAPLDVSPSRKNNKI